MAFTDNPVISTLGDQLGLGNVFAAIKGAASPSPAAPPAAKPGVTKPNIPNYRERPYIPRNEIGSSAKGVGPGGTNPILPGPMSEETLQDPKVRSLLGQYGVTPTDTPPDPNLFIHNPAAFQNHPLAAGLLEHTLRGLAYSHPGENFLHSLAGGARGIQESNAASAEQVNNQLMAPFQQAQTVAGLQKLNDEHAASVGETAYKKAMGDYYDRMASTKEEKAGMMPPRKNEDGSWSTWNPDLRGGKGDYETNPAMGRDEEIYQKNEYFKAYAHKIAHDKYNDDLTKLQPEDFAQIHQDFETMHSMSKGAAMLEGKKIEAEAKKFSALHRANGSLIRMSPGDTKQYQDLDTEEKRINSEVDRSKTEGIKNHFFMDDGGRTVVTGIPGDSEPPAYTAWKADRATKLADIQRRKQQLQTKYGATDTTGSQAPPSPIPNPFMHAPTQTPASTNPFRH